MGRSIQLRVFRDVETRTAHMCMGPEVWQMSAEVRPHTCTSLLLLMIDGPQRFDLKVLRFWHNFFPFKPKKVYQHWLACFKDRTGGRWLSLMTFTKFHWKQRFSDRAWLEQITLSRHICIDPLLLLACYHLSHGFLTSYYQNTIFIFFRSLSLRKSISYITLWWTILSRCS